MPTVLRKYFYLLLSCLPFFLIGFFLVWVLRIFVPVMIVEATYQYRLLLKNTFHTTSFRGVILPSFQFTYDVAHTQYKEGGITIPALFVDEPIVFNVDPNDPQAYNAALKKGIAHASGTVFPGTKGIGYYFAHSSSPALVSQYNAVFYLLGKLKEHDEIYVSKDNNVSIYEVTEKKTTRPDDVSFLHTVYEEEMIVLQTCWPPGTTAQRLLVFARRKH